MSAHLDILNVIQSCLCEFRISRKIGKSHMQPGIAIALRNEGFVADEEDSARILPSSIPVWRSKDDNRVVPTVRRRLVDIVVYRNGQLVAMIETESDLMDIRVSGVSKRKGHYDVASISRNAEGSFFDSYSSLERMAVAAYVWNSFMETGHYPSSQQAVDLLESIQSNDPLIHNPANVPLFIVSGLCRKTDRIILSPRLHSLNAILMSVNGE